MITDSSYKEKFYINGDEETAVPAGNLIKVVSTKDSPKISLRKI
jgi:hypothetical protein